MSRPEAIEQSVLNAIDSENGIRADVLVEKLYYVNVGNRPTLRNALRKLHKSKKITLLEGKIPGLFGESCTVHYCFAGQDYRIVEDNLEDEKTESP